MTSKHSIFTPREIEVATLVKEGRTTKEIAALLNISTKAIEFYRQGLRRKLGLKSRKANLRTHLIRKKGTGKLYSTRIPEAAF